MLRFARLSSFAVAIAAALAACANGPSRAAARGPVRDVLFVGNSFSFYNNGLHNHYREALRAADPTAQRGVVRLLALSGGHLPEHADALRQRLREQRFDVVVLQGHSLDAIDEAHRDAFRDAARALVADVRRAGGRPALLMTWAYTDREEMGARIDDAYTQLGAELGVDVLPVGRAFAAVTAEHPEIALRVADGRHPTLAGTYLAACVVHACLHGAPSAPLAYTADLDADTARRLQAIAARVAVERER